MQPYEPKGSGWKWWLIYFISGSIDLIQLLIGWTGVGTIFSEGLEIFMPFFLASAMLLMRISIFQYPSRVISIFGVAGLDAITGGIAPFWILDVWYLQHSVKKDDLQNTTEQTNLILTGQKPLISNGNRRPTPPPLPSEGRNPDAGPLVINGVRGPQK